MNIIMPLTNMSLVAPRHFESV